MYTIQFVFSGAEQQQPSTSASQDGPSRQVADPEQIEYRRNLTIALDTIKSLSHLTNDLNKEREASQQTIQSQREEIESQREEIERQKKEIEILKLENKKLSSGQRAGNILGVYSKQTSQSRKKHTKITHKNSTNKQT